MGKENDNIVPTNTNVYKDVPKIKVSGTGFPEHKVVLTAAMAYFALFRDFDNPLDKTGIMVFTQDGLNRISDVGLYNALGITRQRWDTWRHATVRHAQLRNTITYIEQILEQVDQERLSTRGNVGDLFRMKVKYKWRDKDMMDEKNAITELSSEKTAEILKRMSK